MKLAFNMKTHNILSIEDFKTNIIKKSRLLGIDPGSKKVGIAICDENQIIATPFKILQRNKFEELLTELKEIIIVFIFLSTFSNPFLSIVFRGVATV